jgi:hypothetical protein
VPGQGVKRLQGLKAFDGQLWHGSFILPDAFMLKQILFSPDPGDGGGPSDPTPAPGATTSNPTPPPAPPPAAETVLTGIKSEREIQLETDLQKEREEKQRIESEKKDREIRISELEDENHQLKSIPTIKTPADPDSDARWRPFKL